MCNKEGLVQRTLSAISLGDKLKILTMTSIILPMSVFLVFVTNKKKSLICHFGYVKVLRQAQPGHCQSPLNSNLSSVLYLGFLPLNWIPPVSNQQTEREVVRNSVNFLCCCRIIVCLQFSKSCKCCIVSVGNTYNIELTLTAISFD